MLFRTGQKADVQQFWENRTCGTRGVDAADRRRFFTTISAQRYNVEHYIAQFAAFEDGRGKAVLEIGVGAGSDFERWVEAGATATGIDLTENAINLTRERLELAGHSGGYDLHVADAECLPFDNDSFDIVYSYGVLHHSPDTHKALSEAFRVLRPGGQMRIMVYGTGSWTGLMLWVRHAFMIGRPFRNEREVIAAHLESPGTKIYTEREFETLLESIGFTSIALQRRLGSGDLLSMAPSEQYQGFLYRMVWRLYPRALVRLLGHRFGLLLLSRAAKPKG